MLSSLNFLLLVNTNKISRIICRSIMCNLKKWGNVAFGPHSSYQQIPSHREVWTILNSCPVMIGLFSWWRRQMETFPCYWPFVLRIHQSRVKSPHKGQWWGALMFSLICVWINGWENNREAGDLKHYRAHYDVTVMLLKQSHHHAWWWP